MKVSTNRKDVDFRAPVARESLWTTAKKGEFPNGHCEVQKQQILDFLVFSPSQSIGARSQSPK
jgi:hypothetical protein